MDYTVVMSPRATTRPPCLHHALRRDQHRRIFHGKGTRRAHRLRRSHAACPRLSRAIAVAPPSAWPRSVSGDIFYIHSRMLERSTHLSQERGGGSLTALPSLRPKRKHLAYIRPISSPSPTVNLSSPTLFELGILPRRCRQVGFARGWSGTASRLSRSSAILSAYSRSRNWKHSPSSAPASMNPLGNYDHGQRIRACLKQPESQPVSMIEQITVLLA